MGYLTIEGPVLQQLLKAIEPVEVRDSQGEVVGIFSPNPAKQNQGMRHLFDPDELRRRKESAMGQSGRSLSEILEKLGVHEQPK